jgi:hypothetical protein
MALGSLSLFVGLASCLEPKFDRNFAGRQCRSTRAPARGQLPLPTVVLQQSHAKPAKTP